MEQIEKVEKPKTGCENNGGARPGSGRKASIDLLAKEETKKLIAEKFLEMAEKVGIPYLENVASGNLEVPAEVRFRAVQEILNRAFGKPVESHDLTSGGKSLTISFDGAFSARPENESPSGS